MKVTVILSTFLFLGTLAFSSVIHVPGDYRTIQDAIDHAIKGDTVMVADGTFTGIGNMDIRFHGKEIVVTSEAGPDFCIIDCQAGGRGFIFDTGENSNSKLFGFTITNGVAYDGGGIHCSEISSPYIESCNLCSNTAENYGGGMYCENGSNPTLRDCRISDNIAKYRGGGIYHRNVTSVHQDKFVVSGCTIIHNETTHEEWGPGIVDWSGAGILLLWSDHAEIHDSVISHNKAKGTGGGICNLASDQMLISHCTISNNQCEEDGGGIYLSGSTCTTAIAYCILNENHARYTGGMSLFLSGADILNCTITENSSDELQPFGVNFYKSEDSSILNAIIWGNAGAGQVEVDATYTNLTVDYSDIGGGYPGFNNIDADPLFANMGEDTYSLLPGSPCIDSGHPGSPPDPDGTVVDMGALPISTWTDMGYALAGGMGAPVLAGDGYISPGEEMFLTLENAQPSTQAFLVIGFDLSLMPFRGGILVPFPAYPHLILPMMTDPAGYIEIYKISNHSSPPVYFQFWIVDASAPQGASASNGLAGYFP